MDDGDDDESAPAAPGIFKPESFADGDIDMTPETAEADQNQDDGDAEDLMGDDFDGDERAAAEAQRQARELERSRANDPDQTPTETPESEETKPKERQQLRRDASNEVKTEASPTMDIDGPEQKPSETKEEIKQEEKEEQEEEEPDPLDAYMNTVSTEVKQINAQDRSKTNGRSETKGVKVSGGDDADEEEVATVELSDMDKVGLNASEIMA